MAKRHDWVPCTSYGGSISVAPQDTLDVLLVAPRDISLPVIGGTAPTEVAVVETESEVATTRVIGMPLIFPPDAETLIIERIRVGLFDNAGAVAFFANSFTDSDDANEPFLWQRVSVQSAGVPNGSVSLHPYWSVIDVRVGRRLRQDQALFYSVFNGAPVGGDGMTVRPFLRTLARQA